MLGEPVLEQGIGDADRDRVAGVGHKRGWLEPGIETVPVHFCFDAGKDFVPDAGVHCEKALKSVTTPRFSTIFSTGVEILGDKPKRYTAPRRNQPIRDPAM